MNGCSGMTDIVWQHVNVTEASQTTSQAAGASHILGHALQSLSLVGCKSLRCCYLGVVPEPSVDLLSLSQHLQQPISWMPAGCHLSGITLSQHDHSVTTVSTQYYHSMLVILHNERRS